MSVRLSTAGIKFGYAVETEKGTRPTSGYTYLTEIKSIPDNNSEPELLETTTLGELEYKTYIAGLKDLGSALTYTMNLTQDSFEEWETLMTAYQTAKDQSLATWFVIVFPGLKKACYVGGDPSPLGQPGAEVNEVLEADVYIAPTTAPVWATAPTD